MNHSPKYPYNAAPPHFKVALLPITLNRINRIVVRVLSGKISLDNDLFYDSYDLALRVAIAKAEELTISREQDVLLDDRIQNFSQIFNPASVQNSEKEPSGE